MTIDRTSARGGRLTKLLVLLFECRSAAIAPLTALMLVPIAGSIAFAVELGSWQYMQRSAQNAADGAALAAATVSNSGGNTTAQMEARAASSKLGFTHGVNNVTVTSAVTPCPAGVAAGSTCYEAIVTTSMPFAFARVIGFAGSGNGRQQISARSVAVTAGFSGGGSKDICVWSLSGGSTSFTSNGGPKPDMAGCSLLSNGGMTCNGHDLGADYGIAVGTSSGCGAHQLSGASPPSDPYAALATTAPNSTNLAAGLTSCAGTFHQLTGNGNKVTVNAANQITGTPAWAGAASPKVFCGDVQLTGDVTLPSGQTTIIIENGRLDLNGNTLKTTGGGSATVVFSGNNNSSYSHYPMSSKNNAGTIDIKAPTTGSWSGVAMYQDPGVTVNTSFTYAGNAPTWNITGLVYLPKANVTFSGIVNKAGNGTSCFVLVAYTVLVNGTGQIFANTQCAAAGLGTPSVTIPGAPTRERLVL